MNLKPLLYAAVLFLLAAPLQAQEAPRLVKNINTAGSSLDEEPEGVEYKGRVYFAAEDDTHGTELWVTDGTEAGTVMVKDINPGGSSSPENFVVMDDLLFFVADDGLTGDELWKTDGTTAGTVIVKDIIFGLDDPQISEIAAFQGALYFEAQTPAEGSELWRSDGTDAGTVLLKDIRTGSAGSGPSELTALENYLLFTADDDVNGRELWRTDGTGPGTVMVKDIEPGALSAGFFGGITRVGNRAYFAAGTDATGSEPWRSDGTNEGTLALGDLFSGGDSSFPNNFTGLGEDVYFAAHDGTDDTLFKTDGSPGSIEAVRDLNDGEDPVNIIELAASGDLLFFSAEDSGSSFGYELWISDGTEDGTVMLRDIDPGSASSEPENLTPVGDGQVFFRADNGEEGDEPWISDGTRDGTRILADLYEGEFSSNPLPYLASQGRVFFRANEGTGLNTELYVVAAVSPTLVNIATRGFVGTGDRVLIAGFIIGGSPKQILVRAIGPSLANFGVSTPLFNPQLQIFSGPTPVVSNNNWRDTQEAEIIATGLAPSHDNESAILIQLNPGPYTAIVSGFNGGTGVGLVEVFEIEPAELAADALNESPPRDVGF